MAKRKAQPKQRGTYGEGSIYPNKDGTFTVAVRLKPGARPVRRRAPDEQTAEVVKASLLKMRSKEIAEDGPGLDKALDTLQRLRDDYIDVEASMQRFDVFIDRWFNEVVKKREGLSERTFDHYRNMIQTYIRPYFGDMILIQIKPPHINAFLNQLRTHLGAGTVKHAYGTLNQALDTAVAWRYIPYNPAAAVEAPKVKRAEKPALTVPHVQSLFAVISQHPAEQLFHVMATLGTRLGETLALRRIDFNQDFSEVHIQTQISYFSHERTKPKDDSVRLLPVPPRLQAQLAAQWQYVCMQQADAAPDFKNHGLMFPSGAGTPFQASNIEKLWLGCTYRWQRQKGLVVRHYPGFKERADLPDWATIHGLRTFVATMLTDLDIEQRIIGHILGHGAKNVTEKYMRRRMATMRRALDKLEQALWSAVVADEETGT